MSNIYFTSDTHFHHKNILNFCRSTRLGSNVDEMNELLIEQWNSQVKPYDTVYHLGDFSFASPDKTIEILNRLNGVKHLILGNHDKWVNPHAKLLLASCTPYQELKYDRTHIVLCHYPIWEWNRMHYGAIHLHGHVHGGTTVPGKILDVGIDNRPTPDMALWTWDEIRTFMSSRPIRSHGILQTPHFKEKS